MHFPPVTGFLIVALLLFAVYRRIRRNVGRQPLRPTRLLVRLMLLGVAGVGLLSSGLHDDALVVSSALGIAVGITLAIYALRHTRIETADDNLFYIGHPLIGLGISVLLVGRVVYRMGLIYPAIRQSGMPHSEGLGGPGALAQSLSNPATIGIAGLTIAYYLVYYAGLVAKGRKAIAGQE
jgi:hypothetical protein